MFRCRPILLHYPKPCSLAFDLDRKELLRRTYHRQDVRAGKNRTAVNIGGLSVGGCISATLTEVLRPGPRRLLAQAVEMEA